MSDVMTLNSLTRLFRFPFEGPDWQKRFGLGVVLLIAGSFVPVLPALVVYGYVLQVMRQAIQGEPASLPEWRDWGRLMLDGLRAATASLVFVLPGLLIFFGGLTLYMIGSIALPLWMEEAAHSLQDQSPFVVLLLINFVLFFLSLALGSLLLLVGSLPLPAALAHMAAHDRFSAAFAIREWWAVLRANAWGYLAAWVVTAGLMVVVYTFVTMLYYTIVLCCFLPFLSAPLTFYMMLVSAAVFGQVYREGRR